jgi:hypothetical protein
MINFKLLWESLYNSPPNKNGDFITVLVKDNSIFNFYYGVDSFGKNLFAIETNLEPKKIQFNTKSIDTFAHNRGEGKWLTVFLLKDSDLISVFEKFCEDIFYSIKLLSSEENLSEFLTSRLKLWKNLLASGKHLLNESEVQGLLGELLVLEKFILENTKNHFEIINGWLGPLKEDKDFKFKEFSLEVKTILGGVEAITISSLSQLFSSEKLYLYILELIKTNAINNESLSLPAQIDKIRNLVINDNDSLSIFNAKLLELGYIDDEYYKNFIYNLIALNKYMVTDDFPKLTIKSVPIGILSANYKISINSIQKFAVHD